MGLKLPEKCRRLLRGRSRQRNITHYVYRRFFSYSLLPVLSYAIYCSLVHAVQSTRTSGKQIWRLSKYNSHTPTPKPIHTPQRGHHEPLFEKHCLKIKWSTLNMLKLYINSGKRCCWFFVSAHYPLHRSISYIFTSKGSGCQSVETIFPQPGPGHIHMLNSPSIIFLQRMMCSQAWSWLLASFRISLTAHGMLTFP